ncbi:hypothetical protein [Mesorhizobium sp.]|uniref:hypothetical protein n=1 Tax=Mesorhizobium sp. TaxID=1871066 RepID=UPI0025C569F9|nr:hypothetical protein [Mesorhizobium sp.]
MTLSRFLAVLAFAVFLAFFGVVIRFVPHPDLGVAIGIGVLLAGYDLWSQLRPRTK